MKIVPPKPFTFKAGKRAVLLLHAFTGNTADVRMLGRFLQNKGYTCHAPLYKGHGVPPEELLHTGPEDWWQDVLSGYQLLKDEGHEKIAVAGLSLGGVFSLKMGYTANVKGIVPMCAPTSFQGEDRLFKGVVHYAKQYKQLEGKSKEQIEKEMASFQSSSMETLNNLEQLNMEVRENLNKIKVPIFVVQARHDELIDPESANEIYETVQSEKKYIKWYEQSTHVITMGKEKDKLHKDIYQFLEELDWRDG